MDNVLYACFTGDGYADLEEPTDGEGPEEGASYWMSPRHAEVGCPSCCQEGTFTYTGADGRERTRDCRTCEGSGLVTGEPFTVTRYTFATEAAALAYYDAAEDTSDGYERGWVLARAVDAGECVAADVVTWDPEHEHDAGGPPPACRYCDGAGTVTVEPDAADEPSYLDVCPECDGAGHEK